MTSKEKMLLVGASLGLALGLVLLFFGQFSTGSSLVRPIATITASAILPEPSDENCDKPCFPKDKQVMKSSKGGIELGQKSLKNGSSFANNTTLTMTNDLAAPVIHQLVIADGFPTTSQQTVTLDVDATDPPPEPISGVKGIRFTEYEYILSIGNWVPIQHSEWVNYAEAQENYPWTLSPTYGIRYLEAWAVDQAGNISWDARMGVINLLPSEQAATLSEGEVNFYRILVEAGQTLTATLTPVSGDPDLSIWGPNDGAWYTNSPTEVEKLAFQAPDTGTYQIEVHGYTEAEYKLNFGTSNSRAPNLLGVQSTSKPSPTEPTLPLDNEPDSSTPSTNNMTATATANLGVNMTSVMPTSGWNDAEVEVALQGSGFTEPLMVTLGSTPLTVTEVLSDRLLAIVPRGLELGWYDITVNSPSYDSVSLSNAYEVLEGEGGEGQSYSVYLPLTIR